MDLVHELCPVKLLKVNKISDNLSGWLTSIQHLAHISNHLHAHHERPRHPVQGSRHSLADNCKAVFMVTWLEHTSLLDSSAMCSVVSSFSLLDSGSSAVSTSGISSVSSSLIWRMSLDHFVAPWSRDMVRTGVRTVEVVKVYLYWLHSQRLASAGWKCLTVMRINFVILKWSDIKRRHYRCLWHHSSTLCLAYLVFGREVCVFVHAP